MGRSQKWPDLKSPISNIRDIRFVDTDDLIIFRKFHNFPWNIVAVARLEGYFVVGSLDLTWWPDLIWHWVEIFTKVAEKMGGKVGENPAAPYFRYPRKTWGGRSNAPPPPAGRGLTFVQHCQPPLTTLSAQRHYQDFAGRVATFRGHKVTPPKINKSTDFVHYFLKDHNS